MLRVLWPVIFITTRSGIPALTISRTAVRRKSCFNLLGIPPVGTLPATPCEYPAAGSLCRRHGSQGRRGGLSFPVPAPRLSPWQAALSAPLLARGSGRQAFRPRSWCSLVEATAFPLQGRLGSGSGVTLHLSTAIHTCT